MVVIGTTGADDDHIVEARHRGMSPAESTAAVSRGVTMGRCRAYRSSVIGVRTKTGISRVVFSR